MKETYVTAYIPIEGGFYGIISQYGRKYIPINMPVRLKIPGQKFTCRVRKLRDQDSIYQWGELVKIISYELL